MDFTEQFRPAGYIHRGDKNDLAQIVSEGTKSPLQEVTNSELASGKFSAKTRLNIAGERQFVYLAIERVQETVERWENIYDHSINFISCGAASKTDWKLLRQARTEAPANRRLLHALKERRRILNRFSA